MSNTSHAAVIYCPPGDPDFAGSRPGHVFDLDLFSVEGCLALNAGFTPIAIVMLKPGAVELVLEPEPIIPEQAMYRLHTDRGYFKAQQVMRGDAGNDATVFRVASLLNAPDPSSGGAPW